MLWIRLGLFSKDVHFFLMHSVFFFWYETLNTMVIGWERKLVNDDNGYWKAESKIDVVEGTRSRFSSHNWMPSKSKDWRRRPKGEDYLGTDWSGQLYSLGETYLGWKLQRLSPWLSSTNLIYRNPLARHNRIYYTQITHFPWTLDSTQVEDRDQSRTQKDEPFPKKNGRLLRRGRKWECAHCPKQKQVKNLKLKATSQRKECVSFFFSPLPALSTVCNQFI